MSTSALSSQAHDSTPRPSVTVVFLVYNRRDELRTSLRRTFASDFGSDHLDVIVVDNASSDGSAAMVREEFPGVQVIEHERNVGVSGWNIGLARARGDYVLLLDDDCYLPPDGLSRAVAAAERLDADMVSFKVVATDDPSWVFSDQYKTGLFMFWGCAALLRRRVVTELEGYDPEIFFLANELEFTLRFFDRGFRHLHLPEVHAQHMKAVPAEDAPWIEERGYLANARNWAYIVTKLFTPRQGLEALIAMLSSILRDTIRFHPAALKAIPRVFRGVFTGLRKREPLRNPELSRFYRQNFETFASPWWVSRPLRELARAIPGELLGGSFLLRGREKTTGGRKDGYLERRAVFYPQNAAILEFSPEPVTRTVAIH